MGLFGSIFNNGASADELIRPIPVGTTLLIDGDAAASEGWPAATRQDQRRNLMHYVALLDERKGCRSIVVFSEHRTGAEDVLTGTSIQFAGPKWNVAEHLARLADARRGAEVLIATAQPQLFGNAETIGIGDLLDHFIAA